MRNLKETAHKCITVRDSHVHMPSPSVAADRIYLNYLWHRITCKKTPSVFTLTGHQPPSPRSPRCEKLMLRVQRSLDHGRISGTKHLGSIRHSLKSLKHLAVPLQGGKLTSESEPSPIQNDSAVGTVAGVSNLSKSQLNKAKFKNCRTAAHFPLPTPFSSSLGFK